MQVAYAVEMDKDSKPESPRRERRRLRLGLLLQENGGAAEVAREAKTPKSHLSAITNRTRGLGDELAKKLEDKYKKDAGWFDLPLDAESSWPFEDLDLAKIKGLDLKHRQQLEAAVLIAAAALNLDVRVGESNLEAHREPRQA